MQEAIFIRAPDTPTARRLAVEGDVDPRTLTRILLAAQGKGKPPRGRANERGTAVLVKHGFLAMPKGNNR